METSKHELAPVSLNFNKTLDILKNNIKARQSLMQSYCSTREPPLVLKPTGWATLPSNILTKIFQYVDRHHLITYCTLVCKFWRRAIMCECFITSLTIANNEASLSFVYNFLREFKTLQTLTLINVPDIEVILMQAHKVCSNLKRISLKNYKYISYNVIAYISRAFPRLEGLNFDSSSLHCHNISTDIVVFKNLKSLNLFNVKAMGLSTQAILEIVLNCTQLEELNIGLCPPLVNLQDDDVMMVITNLAAKLTSLSLDSRRLTMRSLQKLQNCKLLRRIYIKYGVNLTGDFLSEFWTNFYSIDEFAFTHNCIISGYDVSALFQNGVNVFIDLRLLDLTYCVKVCDIGIEAIAAISRKLQKIILKSCRSVTNITPLFTECAELRFIDVSYCTALRTNFTLPKQLEVLVIDERNELMYFVEKFRTMKYLKMYLSTSEFNDSLEPF